MKRAGEGRWTRGAERRFFAALADTANVKMAAEAAGFSTNAIYARRLRHPVFAEQWAAAVETGRARIEIGLIEMANQAIERATAGVTAEGPQMTISEALQILKLGAEPHAHSRPDGRRRLNAGARANVEVATSEEVAEALRRRLITFSKRIDREKRAGEAE